MWVKGKSRVSIMEGGDDGNDRHKKVNEWEDTEG